MEQDVKRSVKDLDALLRQNPSKPSKPQSPEDDKSPTSKPPKPAIKPGHKHFSGSPGLDIKAPRIFARFKGFLDWVCPHCAHVHKTRRNGYKTLHCSNCNHRFDHGLLLFPARPGQDHQSPMDNLFIADGFALRRVNRILCDHCSQELFSIKPSPKNPPENH